MASPVNKKSTRQFRADRKKNIRIVVILILFGLLPASWAIYNHFSPIVDTQRLRGTLESLHQGQSVAGSDFDNFFIRLENGELIIVAVHRDRNVPFRRNAKAEITRTVRMSGKVTYIFEGYAR